MVLEQKKGTDYSARKKTEIIQGKIEVFSKERDSVMTEGRKRNRHKKLR